LPWYINPIEEALNLKHMNKQVVEVIIIGGGAAGLSASYYLKQARLSHLVFERGQVGQSWRSQRWDSFRLNTTNKMNALPGIVDTRDPDGFSSASSLVNSFEEYVARFQLPVIEQTEVIAVEQKDEDTFRVTVQEKDMKREYLARQVVIASGAQTRADIPVLAEGIVSSISQLHVSSYRNPGQLRDGAVLVVGSAQSGCQIADELIGAGKKVFLSTSRVGRLARQYRGRDTMEWLDAMGFFDITPAQLPDPSIMRMRAPQHAAGTETISLQSLARKGVRILGRLDGADQTRFLFQSNVLEHATFADAFSLKVSRMIDEYISAANIDAPPPLRDINDEPIGAASLDTSTCIDAKEQCITTVIWATGFTSSLKYVRLPIVDDNGQLVYDRVHGLHFLGFPWLRSRKSSILFGICDDAKLLVGDILQHRTMRIESF
jgi:putative flavoprotein involved in K+ transport